MKYNEHRHYGVLKPSQQFVRRGKTAPELHQLLERKGFKFQIAPNDYYSFGKEDDWPDTNKQPLICIYEDDSWDGRPVPDHPMKPGTDLKDYLDSLPDVASQ